MVHSYASYAAPTPLQAGVAAALDAEAAATGPDEMSAVMEGNAAVLSLALAEAGLEVFPAEGGYFLVADVASTGLDAFEYSRRLIQEAKARPSISRCRSSATASPAALPPLGALS